MTTSTPESTHSRRGDAGPTANPINVNELAAAVQTLNDPKLRNVSPGYQRLGNAVSRWTSDAGLELDLVQPARTMSHHGLELGL